MARWDGRVGPDHTIPIPIGEGLGPPVTAYTVVVPDKRSADPGPITTGRSVAKTRGCQLAQQPLSVAMDSGLALRAPRNDAEMAPHTSWILRKCGGSSTPRPIGSITTVSGYGVARSRLSQGFAEAFPAWLAVEAASRAMTSECVLAFPRHEPSEVCSEFPALQSEGAGKTGCAPHPRSRVQYAQKKHAHEHTGSAGASRPSLRNGFTAYFDLSPENGSFASVAPEKLSFLVDLTPAPRRQDQTTSPYASATLVCHGIGVHRISPRVGDDGQRPSSSR